MRPALSWTGVFFVLILGGAPTHSGNRYSAELLLGGALNLTSPLAISQDGEAEIEIDAEYSTRPFEFPLYYTVRLGRRDPGGAWELQLIHHKLYLENTTAEVQRFEVTHGFNILSVNRAFRAGPLDLRAGAGAVLAHTESRIRGLTSPEEGILDTGYELGGPALVIGAGKRFRLSGRWHAAFESQVTLGWAGVSVANGEAATTNAAFHVMLGIGYGW